MSVPADVIAGRIACLKMKAPGHVNFNNERSGTMSKRIIAFAAVLLLISASSAGDRYVVQKFEE
jgi:hypothetical protein